ncbi:hypothetical protein BDY24DRAFT_384023 [Mrakia frigida]|uniref:uncharacterized protein n=1 Tax=Mrakia frigida TaxID=29902 RepID=UPI003FCC24FA
MHDSPSCSLSSINCIRSSLCLFERQGLQNCVAGTEGGGARSRIEVERHLASFARCLF